MRRPLLFIMVLTLTGSVAAAAGSDEPMTHEAELDAFAAIMATTRTASERCPGVALDEPVILVARERLHVEDADYFAFRAKAHRLAEALEREAGTLAAYLSWCEDALRRYGPAVTDLPGALRR